MLWLKRGQALSIEKAQRCSHRMAHLTIHKVTLFSAERFRQQMGYFKLAVMPHGWEPLTQHSIVKHLKKNILQCFLLPPRSSMFSSPNMVTYMAVWFFLNLITGQSAKHFRSYCIWRLGGETKQRLELETWSTNIRDCLICAHGLKSDRQNSIYSKNKFNSFRLMWRENTGL